MNNLGFLKAVEKLIGLEIPERAKYIRVIASELHRMRDHLTCVGAIGLELGAFSAFLYAIEARELICDRVTELTGARLTTNYGRIGGLNRDLPEGWIDGSLKTLDKIARAARRGRRAPHPQPHLRRPHARHRRHHRARTRSTSASPVPACAPTAINYDVRKARPYWVYDRIDFDVPVGQNGDNYDRYLMRIEELKQSERIVRQALQRDARRADHRRRLALRAAAEAEVYGTIEGVMAHFKLVMEGVQVPAGEVYDYTEAANGELGWYLVSDGGGRPYKVHVRAPGFAILLGRPPDDRGRDAGGPRSRRSTPST